MPPENEDVVVERGRAPERPRFALEVGRVERRRDSGPRWKVERAVAVPRNRLRKFLGQPGKPVARALFPRAIANDEEAAGADAARQPLEKGGLFRGCQIVEHVEEHDVAEKIRNRFRRIVEAKIDAGIIFRRDVRTAPDLPGVDIEADDFLETTPFPEIEREQAHSATDIEERRGRAAQKFVGRRINIVPAQFAAHVIP